MKSINGTDAPGMPAGAAVGLTVAGPASNPPPPFTVGRAAGWKASALVGVSVRALAVAAGLVVNFV